MLCLLLIGLLEGLLWMELNLKFHVDEEISEVIITFMDAESSRIFIALSINNWSNLAKILWVRNNQYHGERCCRFVAQIS